MNFDPAKGRPIIVDNTELIILDGFTFEGQAYAVLAVRMTQVGTDKMIVNRIVKVLDGGDVVRLEAIAGGTPETERVVEYIKVEMHRSMLAMGQEFRIDRNDAMADSHIDIISAEGI